MSNDQKGLEFQFLESWDGWDDMGIGALFFYKAKPNLYLQGVVGKDLAGKIDGAYLDISTNVFEVYDEEGDTLATFTIDASLIPV